MTDQNVGSEKDRSYSLTWKKIMSSAKSSKKEAARKEALERKARKIEIKELIEKEEYEVRKRLPRKLPKRDCDVYVTRKTSFPAQIKRCQKILDDGNVVYIHGLGTAINRAINLALQLKKNGLGFIEVSVNTSTVDLTDDLEPLTDEQEPDIMTRSNSAVHIKVYRPDFRDTNKEIEDIFKADPVLD